MPYTTPGCVWLHRLCDKGNRLVGPGGTSLAAKIFSEERDQPLRKTRRVFFKKNILPGCVHTRGPIEEPKYVIVEPRLRKLCTLC